MRQEFWVCVIISLYCLIVTIFGLYPEFTFARQPTKIPTVKAASIVRFMEQAGAPDPNNVLRLVNKERVSLGNSALIADYKLGKLAADRAADMVSYQYYAHKNPDGKYYYDFFADQDISVDYSCENLDIVFVADSTKFIAEWLSSSKGHRECMLDKNLVYAGYAVTQMTRLDNNGKEATAYLAVAIHTTEIR